MVTAMGQVDLDFEPSVPVFDANVALGARHDRVVSVDTLEGTLSEMDRAGIGRALVYMPHAVAFDSDDGNRMLLETIAGESRLIPQFAANPAYDNLGKFAALVEEQGVRSIRLAPLEHGYPFRKWTVKPWLDWMGSEGLPVWLDANNFDPAELHDAAEAHPDVTVVLSEIHYRHYSWAMPLLNSLPNFYIEISRFVVPDGITRLLDIMSEERILFGSRFPEGPMSPQLYSLHHSGLSTSTLKAICAGNLERLLSAE